MQFARRASLVVLVLLASVGTAGAECAWVLWSYTLQTAPSHLEMYAFQSTHPTSAECVVALRDWAKVLDQRAYNVTGPAPGGFEVIALKKSSIEYRIEKYFCTPDTVDPRGPKGASR